MHHSSQNVNISNQSPFPFVEEGFFRCALHGDIKWSDASRYKDTRGALLLESEKTYSFIGNMISSEFKSKKIHVGTNKRKMWIKLKKSNGNGYNLP